MLIRTEYNSEACGSCYKEVKELVALKCECRICENYLYDWTVSFVKEYRLPNEEVLSCPVDNFKKNLQLGNIFSKLSLLNIKKIHSSTRDHYANYPHTTSRPKEAGTLQLKSTQGVIARTKQKLNKLLLIDTLKRDYV